MPRIAACPRERLPLAVDPEGIKGRAAVRRETASTPDDKEDEIFVLAGEHPSIKPEDLYSLPVVTGASVSPKGSSVAYVVTTMNGPDDSYVGSIHVASLQEDWPPHVYTRTSARDMQPRWSPDGKRLLFTSDRGERRQLWFIDVDGGEPYAGPTIDGNVQSAVFSPDGRMVAVVATSDAGRREVARRGWRRIDRMRYRADGAGYLDDLPQVWLIDLGAGASRRVTDGVCWAGSPAWSADSTAIAYVAEHRREADTLWRTELWVAGAWETAKPNKIFSLGGAIEAPAWHPDGSRIFFVGFEDAAGYAVAPLRLFSVGADGSDSRCLTAAEDWVCGNPVLNDLESTGGVSAPVVLSDGSALVLGASHGSTGVYRVGAGGAERLTPRSHTISEFSAERRLAAIASDTATPNEVYTAALDGSGWRRVTHETDAWCKGKRLAPAVRFVAKARSGAIDGWHLRASGDGLRPLVLQIHGGPHAAYGDAFFFEFQLLADAGFDVVFCNPRGSQSYGDAFATAIAGDWAKPAFDDCMDALDAALPTGGIDTKRLGVAGGSYGGYLTSWVVGHSERFKAAIAMRPATDLASLWGTSEVGRMLESELGSKPSENEELYRRCSPLTYADRITAPLLLIHAENDYRCPIEQSEQLFTALKRRGADVELLRFSDADHGLSRAGPPRLRVARLTAIVDWFKRKL